MSRRRHSGVLVVALGGLAVALLGCGAQGGDSSDTGEVVNGPVPAEMCSGGEQPVVAAYKRLSGEHVWSACGDPAPHYLLDAVFEDAVVVGMYESSSGQLAFSPRDGTALDDVPAIPDDAVRLMSEAPTVDGVALSGGQDDPVTAVDAATGATVWSVPYGLPYDDVWAVSDGAAYFFRSLLEADQPPASNPLAVVAHELRTGDVRWEVPLVDEALRPFYADEEAVYALWSDLMVLSTDDGSLLWRTSYRTEPDGRLRMTAALPDGDLVFVSFSSSRSSGD
jgi:outer membrane protein assembly factor BamB